jgi:hypothetical protein
MERDIVIDGRLYQSSHHAFHGEKFDSPSFLTTNIGLLSSWISAPPSSNLPTILTLWQRKWAGLFD